MQYTIQNLLVLWLLSGLMSAVYGEDVLLRRFLTEAPVGWSHIRKTIETNVSVDTPSGKVIESGKDEVTPPLQIRLMGNYELFSSLQQGKAPQYLEAINKEYAFSLGRDVSDSPFLLENILYDTQKYRTKHQWRHNHLQGCILPFEGIMMEGAWLEDVFVSPDITIAQIKEIKVDNHPAVEVVFSGNYQVDKYNVFGNGTVVFLPEKNWTLLSYTGENSDARTKTGVVRSINTKTIEYQTFDSIPFPKLIKTSYQRKDGSQSAYIQELGVPGKVKNSDIFYLKHYGFGELEIKPASNFTIRTILMLAGVILIILGLTLYLLSPKKKKQ
ncbi:MAG: hypothetical protein LBT89_03085 [Planctomycetaceae bacterium]|jgi:hypothetical protein|nr:hypothetical protein [Planctomycetaceae bacterium]